MHLRALALRRALLVTSAVDRAAVSMLMWPSRTDNTLLRELRAEPSGSSPFDSRQVEGAHFTRVPPTVKAPAPALIAYSTQVADSLGLTEEDCRSEAFLKTFSGDLPEGTESWATAYGASFAGQYGGQRGDGRAISIGQVGSQEVQLKGAGVTPFSRRFDGRAVLRSTVREFLASEAMAALGVPTTRALCVIATGERVRRQWYDEHGMERVGNEPGAVGTRVARSFLRFGQFELFHQRGEGTLLRELAEHALNREFPHLLVQHPQASRAQMMVFMFDEIAERQAGLVAEWLRVGYAQVRVRTGNGWGACAARRHVCHMVVHHDGRWRPG